MSQNSNSALPQGFSIFQPALGSQLQFFPAVGTQELDDLLNAYLPGPLPASEKRATAVLDFLEHTQVTGQSFKFYPVYTTASVAASPATSASSSFNVSPVNPTWDWSQTSTTASVSSRASSHRVSKTSPTSRHRTTDFSHIPGMKIMTKDGMDVTNSASRGSKTKEQRDHAHLMRIIKACDSCRKKKIRCDPSHKKRGVAQATAPVPATASRTAKPRTSPPPPPPSEPQSVSVSPLSSDFTLDTPLFEFDQAFTFDNLESFDPAVAGTTDLWDEFLQFPPMDFTGDGMDAFVDPAYLSSQPSSDVSASGSASPVQLGGAPPGLADDRYAEPRVRSPESGAFAIPGSGPGSAGGDYTDFNLYSPGSSFSEDERMLEVSSSSSTSARGLSTPSSASGLSPSSGAIADSYEQLATNRRDMHGLESDEQGSQTADARALENHNPQLQTHPATLARLEQLASQSNDIAVSTNANGQLVICCPPGTVVLTSPGASGDGQDVSLLCSPHHHKQKLIPRKVSSSSNVSASSDSSYRRVLVRTVWFLYIGVALLTLIQETIPADLQPSANVDLHLAEQWHRNTDSVCSYNGNLLATSMLTAKKVISQPGSSAFSPETGGVFAVASPATLLTEISQVSSSVASVNLFLQKLYNAVALVAESPGDTQVISPVSLSSAGEKEPGVRSSTIASDGSSASLGMRFTHGFNPSSVTSVSASNVSAYDSEYLSVVHSEQSTAAPVYNLAIPMVMGALSWTVASQGMVRPIPSLSQQTSRLDTPSQPSDFASSVSLVASSVASSISPTASTSSASPLISDTAVQSTTQHSSDTGTSLDDGQLATIMSHAINSVLLATASSVLSDLARWHSDGAVVRSAQRSRRAAPRSRSLAAYHAVPVSVC